MNLTESWLRANCRGIDGDLDAILRAPERGQASEPVLHGPSALGGTRGRGGRPATTKTKRKHTPGVMNGTEARYAERLEIQRLTGEIRGWAYEADRFILGDRASYLVDFTVEELDGSFSYHETKNAYIWPQAWIKIRVAAAIYADETFYLAQWKPERTVRGKPVAAGWIVKAIGDC